MNIQKEISKIGVGITSSQAKKNVLITRLEGLYKNMNNKIINDLILDLETANKNKPITA